MTMMMMLMMLCSVGLHLPIISNENGKLRFVCCHSLTQQKVKCTGLGHPIPYRLFSYFRTRTHSVSRLLLDLFGLWSLARARCCVVCHFVAPIDMIKVLGYVCLAVVTPPDVHARVSVTFSNITGGVTCIGKNECFLFHGQKVTDKFPRMLISPRC